MTPAIVILIIFGLAVQVAVIALAVSLGTQKIREEVTALRVALTSSTPSS